MKAQSSEGERCLSDYIGEFLNYLENKKHLSPHTVFHYGHDLSLFVRYLSLKNKCTMLEVKLEVFSITLLKKETTAYVVLRDVYLPFVPFTHIFQICYLSFAIP